MKGDGEYGGLLYPGVVKEVISAPCGGCAGYIIAWDDGETPSHVEPGKVEVDD